MMRKICGILFIIMGIMAMFTGENFWYASVDLAIGYLLFFKGEDCTMKILKEGKEKEVTCSCPLCDAELAIKLSDIKSIGFFDIKHYITCPCCKNDVGVKLDEFKKALEELDL